MDVVAVSVFSFTMIVLYLCSSLYHALPLGRTKRMIRHFDHAAIYLLIAGTYTPFLLLSLWGKWGLTLLVVIWSLAIVGVVLKSVFIGRLRVLSLVFYLLMGWMIVLAARELWLRVPHPALIYVAVGGGFYTLGTIFYGWKRLPFNHAIWHLFVLGGSVSHYLGILFYLTP